MISSFVLNIRQSEHLFIASDILCNQVYLSLSRYFPIRGIGELSAADGY
ncbi:MAG: hypothetical protein GX097_04275 [Methanomicrobiales archaeon]|nr:hypothetical protein [Methanomicrobiales archaeon]